MVGIYEQVREAILSGEIVPGEALSESVLARRYGVSRTPVREALQRLETEALIVRGSRGLAVRVSTPEEILDIYETRITLEEAAAGHAAERRTPLDLARLRVAQDAMRATVSSDSKERVRANRVFHEALWGASHSPTLVDLLTRLNTHLIRYPTSTLTDDDRWANVLSEHDALIDAIEARDVDRAKGLARDHMVGARAVRLRMYGGPTGLTS